MMTVPLPFVWRTPKTSLELVLLVIMALNAAVAEIGDQVIGCC
jgi:hypothetical protein